MEKKLTININNYILLEFLQMLEYFTYDEDIKEELNQLKKLVNKKTYGEFFKDLIDIEILKEEITLKYIYLNNDEANEI